MPIIQIAIIDWCSNHIKIRKINQDGLGRALKAMGAVKSCMEFDSTSLPPLLNVVVIHFKYVIITWCSDNGSTLSCGLSREWFDSIRQDHLEIIMKKVELFNNYENDYEEKIEGKLNKTAPIMAVIIESNRVSNVIQLQNIEYVYKKYPIEEYQYQDYRK